MRMYKVGDSVTVIGVTPYNSFVGCLGVIVCEGEFHDWLVDVTFPDGNHDKLGYDEYELTPTTPPAPATATAAGVVGDLSPLQQAMNFDRVVREYVEATQARQAELERRLAACEASRDRYKAALEPFAEAWLQVPLGVESPLYIRQVVHDGQMRTESLGIDTSTLEDAHTAWAGLAARDSERGT